MNYAEIRPLRGTESEWSLFDIVPGRGELAILDHEDGTYGMKQGDGVHRFSELPFIYDYVELRNIFDSMKQFLVDAKRYSTVSKASAVIVEEYKNNTSELLNEVHNEVNQFNDTILEIQQNVYDAKTISIEAASRAENAVIHAPYIGLDRYWYLWSFDEEEYIKTEVKAVGVDGQKGDTGASAYEYAVEGGYTGTEEEFAAVMADATARAERYARNAADSAREAASSAEAAAASESAAGESAGAAAESADAAQNAAASAYDLARIAADSAADAQCYRDETGSLLNTARQEIGEFNTAAASARQDIADTGQAQVNAVNNAGHTQVTAVNDAGTAQAEAVNNAGSTQKAAIETAGQEHLAAVNDAGAAQKSAVEAAGVEQVDAVKAAGAEVQLTAKSLVINDVDNNKQYTASIQVKDGKPVLIYDELTA